MMLALSEDWPDMAKSKDSGEGAGKAASRALSDGRSSKSSKSAAGSALTQKPMSKRANLTLSQAERAVGRYLSKKAG
jgi:hypothetical protein